MDPPLYMITEMNIDYLSKLNYIELKNLSYTNKKFVTICNDNSMLRNILYNKNDKINLPPNYNIATAVNELYNLIREFIHKDYPDDKYPKWVNVELFMDEIKRYTYDKLFVSLINYLYVKYRLDEKLDNIITLDIHQSFINLDQSWAWLEDIYTITLPSKVTEYLNFSLSEYFNKDRNDGEFKILLHLILNLFFMTKIPTGKIHYMPFLSKRQQMCSID